jgi:GDP-mannose transporter
MFYFHIHLVLVLLCVRFAALASASSAAAAAATACKQSLCGAGAPTSSGNILFQRTLKTQKMPVPLPTESGDDDDAIVDQLADCSQVVKPLDASPARSPQAVHTALLPHFRGKRILELGSVNGDGISCFARVAKSATVVEPRPDSCPVLTARAQELHAKRVGDLRVVCDFWPLPTAVDADIITWWQEAPSLLNMVVLRNLTEQLKVGLLREGVEAVLLVEEGLDIDMKDWPELKKLASWQQDVEFNEKAECLTRFPSQVCKRAEGVFHIIKIAIDSKLDRFFETLDDNHAHASNLKGVQKDITIQPESFIGALPADFSILNPSLLQLKITPLEALRRPGAFVLSFQISNIRVPGSPICATKTREPMNSSGFEGRESIGYHGYYAGIALLDADLKPTGQSVIWRADDLANATGCRYLGDYVLFQRDNGELYARVHQLVPCRGSKQKTFVAKVELRAHDRTAETPHRSMASLEMFWSQRFFTKHFFGNGLQLSITSQWAEIGDGKNQNVFFGPQGHTFVEVWPFQPRVLWELEHPLAEEVLRKSSNDRWSKDVPPTEHQMHAGSCCTHMRAQGSYPEFLLGVLHYHDGEQYSGYRNIFYAVRADAPEDLLAISKPFCWARGADRCPQIQLAIGLTRWEHSPHHFGRIGPAEDDGHSIVFLYGEEECSAGMLVLSERSVMDMLEWHYAVDTPSVIETGQVPNVHVNQDAMASVLKTTMPFFFCCWTVRLVGCNWLGEMGFHFTIFMLSNALLLLLNKVLLSYYAAPSLLIGCQCLFTAVVLRLGHSLGMNALEDLHWEDLVRFSAVPFSIVVTLYAGMSAMTHVTLETFIMLRSFSPIIVAFLDWLWLGRSLPSPSAFFCLIGISFCGTLYGRIQGGICDLNTWKWVVVWCLMSQFDTVFVKHAMNSQPMNIETRTYWTNVIMAVCLVFSFVLSGESTALFIDIFMRPATAPVPGLILFTSCICGLSISFSGFGARQLASATLFDVLGLLCKCVTLLLNRIVWEKHAAGNGLALVVACLLFAMFYTEAPLRTLGTK